MDEKDEDRKNEAKARSGHYGGLAHVPLSEALQATVSAHELGNTTLDFCDTR